MQPASVKITIRDCIMRRFCKVASPTWQALCQVEDGEISKGKALEIIREECEHMERENFPELIAERETALARVKELEGQATGTEAKVCADIAARQQKGIAKYGTTVAENPAPLAEWLQHTYEELLDAAVYLKRAMTDSQGTEGKV